MRIVRDTPDQIIVHSAAWKASAFFGVIACAMGAVTAHVVLSGSWAGGIVLLGLTVLPPAALALALAERSMLILDRVAGHAEIRQASARGFRRHRFPMAEVHGTRIRSEYRPGGATAKTDRTRMLALKVKRGMDEGLHDLTRFQVDRDRAKAVSERVNGWMRRVRREFEDDFVAPPEAGQRRGGD